MVSEGDLNFLSISACGHQRAQTSVLQRNLAQFQSPTDTQDDSTLLDAIGNPLAKRHSSLGSLPIECLRVRI